jgi:hypothetical protein
MAVTERWICPVCWKSNRPQDAACWKCASPRGLEERDADARRVAREEALASQPEVVPDLVVALPVVVFRSYARTWRRGGIGLLFVPILMAFAGMTDLGPLVVSTGFAVCLIAFGFLSGEVIEGMRQREAWAFAVGLLLSVVGAIGSVLAFSALAPSLISPTGVRVLSLLVFGGAAIASGAGLVLLYLRRERPESPVR